MAVTVIAEILSRQKLDKEEEKEEERQKHANFS